jgi:hypothetical protein
MRLYTTTTTERGKPQGKGGNEYISIELKAGDRVTPIGYIELYLSDDRAQGATVDEWILTWKRHEDDDAHIIAQGHIAQQ